MELDLDPAQPDAVGRAVRVMLASAAPAPDPWWQAGLDDALEPDDEGRPGGASGSA